MTEAVQSIRITPDNATLSESNSKLSLSFGSPVDFTGKKVALSSMYLYNSWSNVNSTFENQSITLHWPTGAGYDDYDITIPAGSYSISEISDYINFYQSQNDLYLVDANGNNVYYFSMAPNHVTYTVTMEFTLVPASLPSGYTNPNSIVLPNTAATPKITIPAYTGTTAVPKGIGVLLGFSAATYPSVTTAAIDVNGDAVPQASPIASIQVICSIADTGFGTVNDQILKVVAPQVGSGELVIVDNPNLVWYPCLGGRTNIIVIKLTDQLFRSLSVQDTQGMQFELLIGSSSQ